MCLPVRTVQSQKRMQTSGPSSPYLFSICAKILAILIKQNIDIIGIIINSNEHNIFQYADDTSLILEDSLNHILQLLIIQTFSHLKLNSSKTKKCMDKFLKKILSTSSLLSKSFVVGLLSMFLLSKYLYTEPLQNMLLHQNMKLIISLSIRHLLTHTQKLKSYITDQSELFFRSTVIKPSVTHSAMSNAQKCSSNLKRT